MERFRHDNTEGYDQAELAELNAAWTQIASHGAPTDGDDDIAVKSMLDNWSETLLAEYDAGKRGEDLVAWFYATWTRSATDGWLRFRHDRRLSSPR